MYTITVIETADELLAEIAKRKQNYPGKSVIGDVDLTLTSDRRLTVTCPDKCFDISRVDPLDLIGLLCQREDIRFEIEAPAEEKI